MTDTTPAAPLRDRIAAALLARIKQTVIADLDPSPWKRGGVIGHLGAASEYDLADAVLAELATPGADLTRLTADTITSDALDALYDELDRFARGIPLVCSDERHAAKVAGLEAELAEARRDRDLAVAHDRQPYPTAWAYDQACAALEQHRQRADTAEAAIARVRAVADRWVLPGHISMPTAAADIRDALDGPTGSSTPDAGGAGCIKGGIRYYCRLDGCECMPPGHRGAPLSDTTPGSTP